MDGDRDRLIDAVRSRLRRYARDDHEAVLESEALKEVAALLDTEQVDLDVSRVCGLLLWCRSMHGPENSDDVISALALLEPVWRADTARVPEEIAEYFEESGPGPVTLTDRWQGPAHALAQHAWKSGDARAAALAVALMRRIVVAIPPTDPGRGMNLANLAMVAQELAEMNGSDAELDEAVSAGRLAMMAFDTADPRRTVAVAATAVALRRKSGRTGSLGDLDEAITLSRAAVAATKPEDPARSGRLSNLGVALTYRYEWTGHRADFDEALMAHREAMAITGASDDKRGSRLVNLATALFASFEDTGRLDELAAALAAIDEVAGITAAVDGVRIAELSSLCGLMRARFRYTGNSADLDRAVQAGAAAVSLLPPGHPDLPTALTNVGLAGTRGRGAPIRPTMWTVRSPTCVPRSTLPGPIIRTGRAVCPT